MSSLTLIARFSSRSEALVVQSLLASEGIETLLPEFNVLMAELDPSMMEHGWRLMGSSEDVFKAQAILRDARANGEGEG